ncbi:MAG: L,D-transpeptidase [Sphingomonas sp.]
MIRPAAMFPFSIRTMLCCGAALAIFGVSCPVSAQIAPVSAPAIDPAPLAADGAIEQLKPGEYLWAPEIAPAGPVTLIVSLKAQRAFTYRNGVPIGVSTISSGRPGHATPTGIFTILQKQVDHKSNLYNEAPMPFMQRLTWDGVALHAGKLPGYPDSHGCIRLPLAFAKLLYGVTSLGLTVVITDDATAPEISPSPGMLAAVPDDGHMPPTAFAWQPEKSPTGPVSIVVSGRDHRIVVLRNGVEIGSAKILIDGPVLATEAFMLRAVDADGIHWLRLPLPGQVPGAASDMSPEEHARAHLPEGFHSLLNGILQPGATLLVTRDSLRGGGTGEHLAVLVADVP